MAGPGGGSWGEGPIQTAEIGGPYEVQPEDDLIISSGTHLITLPPLGDTFKNVVIKSVAGTATVDGFGSETVEGVLTIAVTQNSAITLSPTDNGWVIV